jgi:hypothetical protein
VGFEFYEDDVSTYFIFDILILRFIIEKEKQIGDQ